ncbi:MAG: carboxymuconolactone decarboxylase family protein, partial [Sulfobacillus sp.]
VNLAAALASRVPMCIRNNMVAAQNNGLSLDEIGAIMAAAQFITGTAVLSASLEGLQTIIGDLG